MFTATKFYPNRFSINVVRATLDWNAKFLQVIVRKFGINGEFTLKEIIELFDNFNEPAIRNKFYRMYNQGFFKRSLKKFDNEFGRKNIFVYEFSESWKNYYNRWDDFETGPLIQKKKESIKEIIQQQIIQSSDRYMGEL